LLKNNPTFFELNIRQKKFLTVIKYFFLLIALVLLQSKNSLAVENNSDKNALPELGDIDLNASAVIPILNSHGAGFNYLDNTDGNLLKLSPQYDKLSGVSLDGSFASNISKGLAAGILLTVGEDKNEWLVNTGFDFNNTSRFIFTLGQFRQTLDFNFISGKQNAQITQNNFAGSYQYFLGDGWLNFAELNTYLSDTGSVKLSDKTYFTDNAYLYELWSDPRRIAGSRVAGTQGRLVLTPNRNTVIKIGLGVERLTYKYSIGNEISTHATSSAELTQRLDNGYNFRVSLDAASSQNRYLFGLGRTFIDGSRLGVDIVAIRGHDILNDTQLLISYSMNFGNCNSSSSESASMGLGTLALNNFDASGTLNNEILDTQSSVSLAAPNSKINSNAWANSLVDQVSRRPSYIPAQVIAKIDTTSAQTRLVSIDKTGIPVGSSVATLTGILTVPIGTAVSGILGVTLNGSNFSNAGQYSLSGSTSLIINPNLITLPQSADVYVVTMENSNGVGTTLATITVTKSPKQISSVVISSGIVVINTNAISGLMAPVTGATPVTSISGPGYTGSVTWSPAMLGTFEGNTTYTAIINLTPIRGYTLNGVTANFFTINGATATTNSANSGVITAVFPLTANQPINIPTILGISPPTIGGTPVSSISGPGYTGSVSWSPAVGGRSDSPYTEYTATITLTPTSGYTLNGVTANFFTVGGATTNNLANSGVITATFPASASLPYGYVYQSGLIWAPITTTANWSTASSACSSLTSLGFSAGTWRQPSVAEIVSAAQGQYITLQPGLSSQRVWSSNSAASGRHSVVVLPGISSTADRDTSLDYVSCVH
jgi:hypothetical protein